MRRYDIDWLRVIAIGLLLLYHIGICFQPWGVFIGFIQSDTPLETLWVPMAMLNIWRIPLLFFVSGMGVSFAIRKRNMKQLLGERAGRILLPFLFGIFTIVPLHLLIWQKYYMQALKYSPEPGHLWFLANIFIYVLLLSPLFFYLRNRAEGKFIGGLAKLYGKPAGLLVIILPFVLEAMLVRPETYELYAMTLHGFFMGLLAFFFGFTCVQSGDPFWQTVLRWRWFLLAASLTLFLVRYYAFELESPGYLMAIESNAWIFTMFGFACKHLNRPSRALSYLSQGAYPVYIIHMIFLYLGSFLILPLEIPAGIKFILIVLFTGSGCFILYDLVIRRTGILRPFFGLKHTPARNKSDEPLQQKSIR
jgi:glucan biosynthesis protein C